MHAVLKAAILCIAILAVYWPALHGEFIWDDALLVAKNPLVTGRFNLGSIWFHTDFPLSLATLWVQWLAWGSHPIGYHIVNVLLHVANALLLWAVLAQLEVRGAWLAAALFAVHPVCVASVAWISELKNTLSLLFFLLSLGAYWNSDRLGKVGFWYWLSLVAFLAALLSKTSTVMLPLVLLISAWWKRGRLTQRDFLHTMPFLTMALTFGSLTVWFQHRLLGGEPVQTEGFGGRLAGSGMALWFYLGKVLLPWKLNMIYPQWEIHSASIITWLPIVFWCGILFVCWRFRHGCGKHALFALAVFSMTLFPALGFFDMYFLAFSRVSDHFQYLPMTAITALFAAGIFSLQNRSLKWLAGILLVVLFLATVQRAQVFSTDESLWRDTLTKNPQAWIAWNNLGTVLAQKGKLDDAAAHFQESLRLNPKNAGAHCNLARVLSLQGKFADAEAQFQTALALKPNSAEVQRSYGAALAEHGNVEESIRHLHEAVQIEPDVNSFLQLGTLLYQTHRSSEAAAAYRQALTLDSNSLEALNNLAWILATCSDPKVRNGVEAVRLAEKACHLTAYKQARAVGILAAAYAEAGRFTDAANTAAKAVELATTAGDAAFANLNRQLLGLYRSAQAYHE